MASYFANITERCRKNDKILLLNHFLMRPSRLFFIAVSLCCQLKTQLADDSVADLTTENLVFAICGLHSSMGSMEPEASQSFWVSTGHDDQVRFLRAFQLLDPRNGRATFLNLISGITDHSSQVPYGDVRFLPVRNLIKALGKIALQMEPVQVRLFTKEPSTITSKSFFVCSSISGSMSIAGFFFGVYKAEKMRSP